MELLWTEFRIKIFWNLKTNSYPERQDRPLEPPPRRNNQIHIPPPRHRLLYPLLLLPPYSLY